jgi:hypothetical protein
MRKPFRTGLRARIKFYSFNRLASVRVACSMFFQNADALRREDDPRHASTTVRLCRVCHSLFKSMQEDGSVSVSTLDDIWRESPSEAEAMVEIRKDKLSWLRWVTKISPASFTDRYQPQLCITDPTTYVGAQYRGKLVAHVVKDLRMLQVSLNHDH